MKHFIQRGDDIIKEIIASHFENLANKFVEEDEEIKNFLLAHEKFTYLNRIINVIGDYYYLREGIEKVKKLIYHYTKHKYYLSPIIEQRIRVFYSTHFPYEVEDRVREFLDVYAMVKGKEIKIKDFESIAGSWMPKVFWKILK